MAVVKEKHNQYTVRFRHKNEIRLVTFKMIHACNLKFDQTKNKATYVDYKQKTEHP